MTHSADLSVLDKHIIGRVRPHIYAFTTGTVPSYLKIGDTYRPVSTRLAEWRQVFPDLESRFQAPATLGEQEETYFRDYSVHKYLENNGHDRLQKRDCDEGVYYSREFFRNTSSEDVEQAIEDIRQSYDANDARYAFYDAVSSLPQNHVYARSEEEWELRPNQQETVDNFKAALAKGRTHLLMYAVMRFGKSFTSLACAKAMDAKAIVVVSAKADVLEEWKKTTEIPANFELYRFLTSEDLKNDPEAIAKTQQQSEVPVLFLTLQDLQGKKIKEKHKQVFETAFDLLIIDESHYGARAESYGQVLRDSGLPEENKASRRKELADTVDPDEAASLLKTLNSKVRLHLSGTPYRILMGSEFSPDDIVAFVQFSDIVQEQEAWDKKHLNEDGINEWENPYFGFPQMVRFAFNLNESSRARIEQLRSEGVSATLSALLAPKSVKATEDGQHKHFEHEPEVLDLLKIIDGTQKDPHVLGFLDYEKIKDGNMCRHMVMVLPYCASCDAMEELIKAHAGLFKNLADYEIINISGIEAKKQFKDTEAVKQAIKDFEEAGKKTITLTVNRMLTGSTVEEWDTMLFLKDTSSPQEYDQAVFRLQNQYVRTLQVGDNSIETEERTIRHCLKPQTILVDFDPIRMFRMQEQKALIYNVNTDGRGNDELEERLKEELRISPIITLNSDLITEVQPTDILQAVSNYSANRTITDEVMVLPVDFGLFEDGDLRTLIESQAEIGNRRGLEINPNIGDDKEAKVPKSGKSGAKKPGGGDTDPPEDSDSEEADDKVSLEKKMRTYYQRILFFAMLAKEPVNSLKDIIGLSSSGEHPRILRNLGIQVKHLELLRCKLNPFNLTQLDYKISNVSRLIRDPEYSDLERAQRVLSKFNRISESEVRTPSWLCEEILHGFPEVSLKEAVANNAYVLDIASKFGEFAIATFALLTQGENKIPTAIARQSIISIPTSLIAYEFTRLVYGILSMPVENVVEPLSSNDLLRFCQDDGIDLSGLLEELEVHILLKKAGNGMSAGKKETMRFAAIVGNPPYQEKDKGAGASSRPIYQFFVDISESLSPDFDALIIPTRWFSGGKGLAEFRARMLRSTSFISLHDFEDPSKVFAGTNNRGGICYFVRDFRDSSKTQRTSELLYVRHERSGHISQSRRTLDPLDEGLVIRDHQAISLVRRMLAHPDFTPLSSAISSRKPFGIESNISKTSAFHREDPREGQYVRCIAKRREPGYIDHSLVRTNYGAVGEFKVFFARANNIGTELDDNNINAFVGNIGEVCTEAYIMCGHTLHLTLQSAENLVKYLNSRFARYLHSLAKASHDATSATFRFVPLVDVSGSSDVNWSGSSDDIDLSLCKRFGLTPEETNLIFAFDTKPE